MVSHSNLILFRIYREARRTNYYYYYYHKLKNFDCAQTGIGERRSAGICVSETCAVHRRRRINKNLLFISILSISGLRHGFFISAGKLRDYNGSPRSISHLTIRNEATVSRDDYMQKLSVGTPKKTCPGQSVIHTIPFSSTSITTPFGQTTLYTHARARV